MISESFAKYVNNVRKPCNKIRVEKIEELNKKMLFSQISANQGASLDPIKQIKQLMVDASGI